MVKLANIPRGPASDSLETRVGTEELLTKRAAEHRAAASAAVEAANDPGDTALAEAEAARQRALDMVAAAKAKVGQPPQSSWDQRMDAAHGIDHNDKPVSGGGRVDN